MSMSARRLTRLGLLIALGLVLNLLERQFPPPVPVPGVRLGLANLATLMALLIDGPGGAFMVWLLRFVLAGMLSGSLFAPGFLVGGAGGLAAWAVMAAIRPGRRFGVGTVSVGGAAAHHLGQLAAAAVLTSTPGVLTLLWPMLALGVPTGLLTGFAASLLAHRLPGFPGVSGAGRAVTRADLALGAAGAVVAIAVAFWPGSGALGSAAEVSQAGQVILTLDLTKDGLYPIPRLLVEVHEGAVRVLEAECPDQVCVVTGWVRHPGDLVVCAPNRTVIRITGEDPDAPDAILR